MLPDLAFAIGSVAWLAAGGVVRLRRGRKDENAGSSVARGGPRLDYVLLWIGLLWVSLALF
jgi:hypothetical protein